MSARLDRLAIFDQLTLEREAQDIEWGGPAHDDKHSVDDWGVILLRHLGLAMNKSTGGPPSIVYRRQLIRVAAVCVAAIESYDRLYKEVAVSDYPGTRPDDIQPPKMAIVLKEGNEGRDPAAMERKADRAQLWHLFHHIWGIAKASPEYNKEKLIEMETALAKQIGYKQVGT